MRYQTFLKMLLGKMKENSCMDDILVHETAIFAEKIVSHSKTFGVIAAPSADRNGGIGALPG